MRRAARFSLDLSILIRCWSHWDAVQNLDNQEKIRSAHSELNVKYSVDPDETRRPGVL